MERINSLTQTLLTSQQFPTNERRLNGFTEPELRIAFSSIQNPEDWKAPIKAYVNLSNLPVVIESIVFFTATEPVITRTAPSVYLVESIGYRKGPAGDH